MNQHVQLMTGPQHVQRAMDLTQLAVRQYGDSEEGDHNPLWQLTIRQAQVHATLAQAATAIEPWLVATMSGVSAHSPAPDSWFDAFNYNPEDLRPPVPEPIDLRPVPDRYEDGCVGEHSPSSNTDCTMGPQG